MPREDEIMRVKVCAILQLARTLGDREVVVGLPKGSTLEDLLALIAVERGFEARDLLSPESTAKLQPSIRILVNGRQPSVLQGMRTPLADGDEVLLLPLVGGG